ncbi:MAG TPA: ABC transporter substrate-binding protein [Candidatus Saccharimonadales bacterium]|nr:ABC transporter substrate-binding protein [Candidatus Saccharimonadales bacterium]
MAVIKRRLLFWLLKAYLKKWGKVFVLFFIFGLIFFFIILLSFKYFSTKIFPQKEQIVGVVGTYTVDTLPESILADVSHGLTKINKDGTASPALASSWDIRDSGKTYIFHLRHNIYFSDGSPLVSRDINYDFSDVTIQKPDKDTIIFHLKEVYSPFLLSVSHPIFKNGFVGIGDTKIKDIKLNSNFIESIKLVSTKGSQSEKLYQFYPTEESVKVAFALGEISEADNISNLSLQHTSLSAFPNVSIKKNVDYTQLVSLFYNTQEKNLSDKRLRDALTYALPNTFSNSERAHSPLLPASWAYQADTMHIFDITHAKLLLEAAGYSDKVKVPPLVISALPDYQQTAQIIASSWEKLGIKTTIVVVPSRPDSFQIYLGNFLPPRDPDQYTLWHSGQQNNITNYKNLRIDKLLEEGRKTLNQDSRIKTYADFQKYLMDDAPASFLYFPITYTITRK